MINLLAMFAKRAEVTRQQTALQQIDMAIELFHRDQWACAITLALAAETQLPDGKKPFVIAKLRSEYGGELIDGLNEPRNWLKHAKEPDTYTLFQADAVVAILRAISKFTALYSEWSEDMAAFDTSVKEAVSNQINSANSN
jgi:hypothetical protein